MPTNPRRTRADTPEARNQRAEKIRAVARRLLARREFEAITMAEIARAAGLAKGTVFLYFRTKEEVFLDLAEAAVTEWASEVERRFAALPDVSAAEAVGMVSEAMVEPAVAEGRGKLMAILDDTLEHNIDHRRARQFKLRMKALLSRIGGLLEQRLPELAEGEGATILQALFVCLIGAYKVSTPSRVVRRVIAEPGLEVFRAEFGPLLRRLVVCQIRGALAERRGSRR